MSYYNYIPHQMPYPPDYYSSDPVIEYQGKWYFWDEVWQGVFGKFDTEQEARAALAKYGETL